MAVTERTRSGTKWKKYASIASDTTLPWTTVSIYVGGGGDVYAFQPGEEAGTAEPFLGVPSGVYIPIQTGKLGSATTATNITIVGN